METEPKEPKEELRSKRDRLFYLGISILFSFLAIRISGYNVSSSDSILFAVVSIFKNSIVNKDFFLLNTGLIVLITVIIFLLFLLNKRRDIAVSIILLLWGYVYFNFKGLINGNLFLLSSLPFFTLTIIFLFCSHFRKS
jgi:hypothetical protein